MTDYGSLAHSAREKYIDFLKADFEIYIHWIENRLDPMFDIAKLKCELQAFHNYLYFQDKEDTKEIRDRLKSMVDLVCKIDSSNNDAYVLELVALQSQRELRQSERRVKELEATLNEMQELWGVLPVKNIDPASFHETELTMPVRNYTGKLLPVIPKEASE